MPDRAPTPSAGAPIGRRVAYWRGRRNMSQQLFADRLGKSKSWVGKVELGARRLDRYSVLEEIAGVLRIDVEQLLGSATSRGGGPRDNGRDGVDYLCAALERYPPVSRSLAGSGSSDLTELDRAVEHAWLAYQHADYERLVQGLPRLLRDTQTADHQHIGDDGTRAAHLLAQAYQITSSVLRKLGDAQLARLTADRAVSAAVRANDPLLAGVAITRAGNALLALDRPRAALETHLAAAQHLAPTGTEPTDPARLSVFGSLLLQGAMAAAHLDDRATVHDLLRSAEQAAETVGDDHNHYWTSFGPTNLHLYRIATAVELGNGKQALDTHHTIDPQALARLVPERRADHLLDLARAHAQTRDPTAATEALLDAERLAPAEIRHRPAAREVITDLLAQTRGASAAAAAELAKRVGLTR